MFQTFLFRCSSLLLATAVVIVFMLTAPHAEAGSIRDDPAFSDFKQSSIPPAHTATATPKPARTPAATKNVAKTKSIAPAPKPVHATESDALEIPPLEIKATPAPAPKNLAAADPKPRQTPLALQPDKIETPSATPTPLAVENAPTDLREKQLAENRTLVAVIDLDTDTLDPKIVATVTQCIWNEVQRTQHTLLLEIKAARRILSDNDLTPTDPYRPYPSKRKMARALQSDYLVYGNLNGTANNLILELSLYGAQKNSIVQSKAARTTKGLEDLLQQIPAIVRELQKAIPERAAVPFRFDKTSDTDMEALEPTEETPTAQYRAQELSKEVERVRQQAEPLKVDSGEKAKIAPKAPTSKKAKNMKTVVASKGEMKAAQEKLKARPAATPASTPAPTPAEPTPVMESPVEAAKAIPSPTVGEELPLSPSEEALASEITATPKAAATNAGKTAAKATAEATPEAKETPEATPSPEPTASPAPAETPATPANTEDTKKSDAQAKFEESQKFPSNSPAGVKPLEEAIALDPANDKYKRALVMRLYYAKQFSAATAKGEKFIQEGSKDIDLYLFVSAAYSASLEYSKALTVIDRILKIQPTNGYALYNRALNLYLKKDPGAAEAFRYYLKLKGNDPEQAQWVLDAEKKLQELEKKNGAGAVKK